MAPETKQKKRKAAASAPSPTAKKSKKAPAPAVVPKPSTGMSTRSSNRLKAAPRSKAADFMSDGSDSEDGGWAALEAKKPKGEKVPAIEKPSTKVAASKKSGKKGKNDEVEENGVAAKTRAQKSTEEGPVSLDVSGDTLEADDSADDSAEEEIDNQTATLLKGFESSDEEEENDDGVVPTARQMAGAKIPDERKTKKRIGALAVKDKSTPGVIYLGRIPHGFYEQEMRSYFSQFGTVTRLRLSRNRKTGHSKHYAFIEFADSEVAKIVTETMDNYLLFGHILKCKIVPRDDLEFIEKLFKGAGKKFKPRPGARLHQRVLERKRTAEEWEKEVIRETSRRKYVNEKMKKKGIDYEFEAPEVKKPEPMEIDEAPVVIVEETVAIATVGEPVSEETIPEKRGKKGKKTTETIFTEVVENKATITTAEKAPEAVPGKKGKKGKKATKAVPAAVIEETVTVTTVEEAVPEKKKGKKGKKTVEATSAAVIEETIANITVEKEAHEKAVPEKKKGKKGKKITEAAPTAAVIEETATIAAAEEAPEKLVPKKKKKGKKGKTEVTNHEEVVEEAIVPPVEAVAVDDGIDELEAQAVVKKPKSKSKAKLPGEVKMPTGRVTRKSTAKKSKA